jgi:hypothetical protein
VAVSDERQAWYDTSVRDPGLDRHEWSTAWESFEEDLHTSPAETLPELNDLVGRMLAAHGFVTNGEDGDPRAEAEEVIRFRAAREITHRVDRGDDVDPGDIADAVNAYREIYEGLIDEPDN